MVYHLRLPAFGAVGAEDCQDIPITDDIVVDEDREMTFTLGVVNSNDLLGDITTHTVTITDNDGMYFIDSNVLVFILYIF